ncbi:MAG: c-type cytochrome biogenesis protein CcmI [Alphaproteobacteria bacterium]
MLLFFILGLMTAAALLFLLAPLLRPARGSAPRRSYDLEIYRNQLKELASDLDRGLVTPDQREQAEREIQRRMLAAAADPDAKGEERRPASQRVATALTIAVVLPLAAGSLYLALGSPGLEGRPFAAREQVAPAVARTEAGPLEEMIERLVRRLETNPNDLESWLLLAQSYREVGRREAAVIAFRHAAMLSDGDPEITAGLGEAIVFAADGMVTPEAIEAFGQVLARDPDQPAARFYLALARLQAGQTEEALAMWGALVESAPPGASWLPRLRQQIADVAREDGLDPADFLPEDAGTVAGGGDVAPGPTQEDMAAAREMSDEDRITMIRDMVERLAARLEEDPDDAQGWQRLGRSYLVLGEAQAARDAYARAAVLRPGDIPTLEGYAEAILAAAPPEGALPEEAVTVYRRLLTLDANNGPALWYLGLAEAQAGNREEGKALWQRLLNLLPPDSPEYANLKGYIAELDGPK